MVVPGWTFFNAVLAADIIHDDMTPSRRAAVDAALLPVAEFFVNAPLQWPLNVYGARLIWGLYKNDETLAASAVGDYVRQLYREISPDGVFRAGPSYSVFRMAGANLAKTYSIDVLAFTGRKNLYEDPRLVSLYEWTYGYGVTPFGTFYSFGDTGDDALDAWSPRARSAHRFSRTAATNAAWAMRNVGRPETDTRNALLAYVLMDRPMPAPATPPGRIFPDGGAWFLEKRGGTEALAGALNNLKTQYQGHMHKDANAVHLVAYGEDVVRNSGYSGWGQGGGLGFGWEYVNATAKSSNTVTVDGLDFESKPGGGITEGLTGASFDYASGRSGPGLSNGVHERNFCFAHPTEGANGYFVLFDEVFSSGGESADMYLHPNSDDAETEASLEMYRWPVGSFKRKDLDVRRTDNDVNVTVFLATPPDTAEIKKGLLASWDRSFVGEYLHATYPVENENARFATVIFPHDKNHARPEMTRIGVSGKYTGARIEHGGENDATDFVVQPPADRADRTMSDMDGRGVSASGAAVWFRMKGKSVDSFFFRKRKLFEGGGMRFETGDAASLLVEGTGGRIISEGTTLAVERETPTGFDVFLDGSRAARGRRFGEKLDRGGGSRRFARVRDRASSARGSRGSCSDGGRGGSVSRVERPGRLRRDGLHASGLRDGSRGFLRGMGRASILRDLVRGLGSSRRNSLQVRAVRSGGDGKGREFLRDGDSASPLLRESGPLARSARGSSRRRQSRECVSDGGVDAVQAGAFSSGELLNRALVRKENGNRMAVRDKWGPGVFPARSWSGQSLDNALYGVL